MENNPGDHTDDEPQGDDSANHAANNCPDRGVAAVIIATGGGGRRYVDCSSASAGRYI